MSPVSMLMIHNPMTIAMGDHAEMQKAIDMLAEVKESIINAYVLKTGLSRAKLSHLMDSETWMNANKAVELGFADGVLNRSTEETKQDEPQMENSEEAVMFSSRAVNNALQNKLTAKYGRQKPTVVQQSEIPAPETNERNVDALLERLDIIKNHI